MRYSQSWVTISPNRKAKRGAWLFNHSESAFLRLVLLPIPYQRLQPRFFLGSCYSDKLEASGRSNRSPDHLSHEALLFTCSISHGIIHRAVSPGRRECISNPLYLRHCLPFPPHASTANSNPGSRESGSTLRTANACSTG